MTAEFKINYITPAIGMALIARASALHGGKTQAVCCCDVFAISADGERLCAAAQGAIARVSRPGD